MTDNTVCFRVTGKPTLEVSNQLRQSAGKLLEAGRRVFAIDLAACPSADSTFIGVLLFLAKGARQPATANGRVSLWDACDLVRRQLDSLGVLDRFRLEACAASDLAFQNVNGAPASKAETTRTCFDAHVGLVAENPANAAKFKDVLKFLEEDLKQSPPPPPAN